MNMKKPTHRNKLVEDSILVLVITGLTILLGLLLSEVQSRLGLPILLVALFFFLSIYGLTIWILQRPLHLLLTEALEDIQQKLIPKSTTYPFMLDTEQLVDYELNSSASEIWLLTSDLLDDVQGGPFQQVVETNLKRGIKYVYFVPNTSEMKARAIQTHALHNNNKLIKIIYLPDTFFFLVTNLDIVIYNPLTSYGGSPRTAFMGLPAPIQTNHYHTEVSRDLVDRLVGHLLDVYQKQQSIP